MVIPVSKDQKFRRFYTDLPDPEGLKENRVYKKAGKKDPGLYKKRNPVDSGISHLRAGNRHSPDSGSGKEHPCLPEESGGHSLP